MVSNQEETQNQNELSAVREQLASAEEEQDALRAKADQSEQKANSLHGVVDAMKPQLAKLEGVFTKMESQHHEKLRGVVWEPDELAVQAKKLESSLREMEEKQANWTPERRRTRGCPPRPSRRA